MSTLSDYDLRGAMRTGGIIVRPFDDGHGTPSTAAAVQPASLDLRLDRHFQVLRPGDGPINPQTDSSDLFDPVTVDDGGALQLNPGECVLGSTVEHVSVGNGYAARVEGKSSLGRLFLLVHVTAGFIDPGFRGHITLELVNLSPRPWLLWPGMRIAQLTVQTLTQPCTAPYGSTRAGSHYQDQPPGPVLSRAHHRFSHGLVEAVRA